MSVIYLRDVRNQQTIQERSRATVQTYHAEPNEGINVSSEPSSRKRRLDVDGVLARSLQKVAGEEQIGAGE